MRKLLICSLFILGCQQPPPNNNLIEKETLRSQFGPDFNVYEMTYNSHKYIIFDEFDSKTATTSVVHSPDCECLPIKHIDTEVE